MDVGNPPRQLGLGVRGADRAPGHGQLRSGTASEDDSVVLVLSGDLEAEGAVVVRPRSVQVLGQKDRKDGMIAQHRYSLCSDRGRWARSGHASFHPASDAT